jgi:hypothetical protein
MDTRGLVRQGDVLLVPVEKAPEVREPRRARSHVLAEGEATGHAHRLSARLPVERRRTVDGRVFFVVPAGGQAQVVHEEHDTLALAEGVWELRQQREYEPTQTRRWRAVRD